MSGLVALSDYIAQHGWSTDIRDGQVWALIGWSMRVDDELVTGADWEPMGSTFPEVREALGY